MITIEQSLPAFAFAGNPLLLKVISDNFKSTAGSKAILELAIGTSTDQTAGHSFTLSFNNTDLVFVSATTPDDSGLQYQKASAEDTYITWTTKIYNAFVANYFLSTFYDIEIVDIEEAYLLIRFTAKENGTDYTLEFTNDDATSISEETQTDGVDPVYRDNFIIVASIWDGLTKISEDIKPVDSAGRATFNFSEYLKSLLDVDTPRFTWPEVAGTNTHEFTNYVQAYLVSLAEKYDGNVRKLTYDTLKHAIGGGLSRETLVTWNDAGDLFFDDADNIKKFLTWAPSLQEIGMDVPQKLFFVFQTVTGYTQYRLVATMVLADGSVSKQYCSELATITTWSVVECSVGYLQLGLDIVDPQQNIIRWYVFLENENGLQISESRGFLLDLDVYETQRVFMFRNSFSAYDVVRFTGKGEMSPDYDRVSGFRIQDDDYTALNAPMKLFSNVETQKMKASSGWITVAQKKHLRDFLLSQESYEIVDDKLYPIVITSNKAQSFTNDDITLLSLDIDYERSYTDMYWSDLLAAAPGVITTEREYSDDYNPIEYS